MGVVEILKQANMSYRAWFQCINPECGATYPLNRIVYQCEQCQSLDLDRSNAHRGSDDLRLELARATRAARARRKHSRRSEPFGAIVRRSRLG